MKTTCSIIGPINVGKSVVKIPPTKVTIMVNTASAIRSTITPTTKITAKTTARMISVTTARIASTIKKIVRAMTRADKIIPITPSTPAVFTCFRAFSESAAFFAFLQLTRPIIEKIMPKRLWFAHILTK